MHNKTTTPKPNPYSKYMYFINIGQYLFVLLHCNNITLNVVQPKEVV